MFPQIFLFCHCFLDIQGMSGAVSSGKMYFYSSLSFKSGSSLQTLSHSPHLTFPSPPLSLSLQVRGLGGGGP